FWSEARALTNFAGNAVATVLIGTWTKEFDHARAAEVLGGRLPFDETTLVDDGHGAEPAGAEPVGTEPAGAEPAGPDTAPTAMPTPSHGAKDGVPV
ncbi:hypothetical protein ACFWN4_32460, partial [Streptomyces sp. NPDC058412]